MLVFPEIHVPVWVCWLVFVTLTSVAVGLLTKLVTAVSERISPRRSNRDVFSGGDVRWMNVQVSPTDYTAQVKSEEEEQEEEQEEEEEEEEYRYKGQTNPDGSETVPYSEHEVYENTPSKIVGGLLLRGKASLACPKCKATMPGLEHGECRNCPKCHLSLTRHGNGLTMRD